MFDLQYYNNICEYGSFRKQFSTILEKPDANLARTMGENSYYHLINTKKHNLTTLYIMYSQMVGVEYHLWFNKYKN
jgi:hypothetical protein